MSIEKKYPSIKYTSRDFNTIRNDLIEYAKRYYPDTYKDFNEASFGSLMVDTVAYVGDVLSFYLDYQANESFLATANEYNNVIKHGKAMGYKFEQAPSSQGICTFYVRVPALSNGLGPDPKYLPKLKKGSVFGNNNGSSFTLNEEVNFGNPSNRIVVSKVNESTGIPTEFAIRGHGQVISGEFKYEDVKVGDFERFRRVSLSDPNVFEIVSVVDSEGKQYFEVEYLSQDVIFSQITNVKKDKFKAPFILKPVSVPRRFIIEQEFGKTFIRFGYGDEKNLANDKFLEPNNVALKLHGRNHTTDESFDPSNLVQTDKFGVGPSNTTLRVTYRKNIRRNVNTGANTVTVVKAPLFRFDNPNALAAGTKGAIIDSLEVSNDQQIIGSITYPSVDEVKRRIYDNYASQNRAVTAQDYKAIVYRMPAKFGAIKRCNVLQDHDAFKRNLNLFVVSEDTNGNLTRTSRTIKNNLKTWLNQYRMINDTVDILNAKIVNIGIDFFIASQPNVDKTKVLDRAKLALRREFLSLSEISESINISNLYRILNLVPGVADTIDVKLVQVFGPRYSPATFDINGNLSPDGRFLLAPEDVVFEVKFLDRDIRGRVK